MENVFYNSSALLSGFDVFVSTAILRTTTSTLLHASASAILGYGIARKYLYGAKGTKVSWLPYYLAAVLLHAMFNGFAVAGEVIEGEWVPLIGLVAASVLAIGMFIWTRSSVRSKDRE
jgi:RsiW-degrading membrane proteinase PrsW (M82 family)